MKFTNWARRLAASAVVLLTAPAFAATSRAPPAFASPDAVSGFVNTYRHKPHPEQLPALVHAMAQLGMFVDEDGAAVHIGFIAGVLGSNQLKAGKLVGAMLPLRSDEEAAVIKAVAYSGLPNWRGLLNDQIDRLADRKLLIDSLATGKTKLLMDMPVDEGRTLDMLWGYYLATGYYQPVQRILSALPMSNDKDDLEKLLVGSMVKWTLTSNAAKDQGLLRLYYAEMKVQPDKVAKPLKDVIDAIEMAETGKIKKQAQAAVEELRTKGPASKRTMAWGTQIASTAIAAGCIVAGATGHVELGLPCIIGGAASQGIGHLVTSDGWSAKSFGLGGN